MIVNTICMPALIYLIFSIAYVLIDTFKGLYNTAMIKIFYTIFFTFILNYLCQSGLGILSWLIIFIPFILMSVIITLLLFSFNLDPKTGKVRKEDGRSGGNRDVVLYHDHGEGKNGDLKHGEGVRIGNEPAGSIEDKRNYRYRLDANNAAGPEMRHIRDQRLVSY